MKRLLCSLVALVSCAGVGFAADHLEEQAAVIQSMLTAMDRITETLKNVVDKDSAQQNHAELQKLAKGWVALRKRAESVPPPTREEKEQLAKAYEYKMREAQKKLFVEIARVTIINGGSEVLSEIRSVYRPPEKKNDK